MVLEKTVEDLMASSPLFFLNHPLSWIVVLAPLLVFATFLIVGSFLSILLTSTALVLSTFLFLFSKQRRCLVGKSAKEDQHQVLKCAQETSTRTVSKASKHQPETTETITQNKGFQEGEDGNHQIFHDNLVKSPDVLSESECMDQFSTTEDSEVDWPLGENLGPSPDYSDDGSISDEDSLIEIALPGGHYVDHHHQKAEEEEVEEPKFMQQKKLAADWSVPESLFHQRSLNIMELLAELNEMNEEDNLIEIDISMGSIKCSRFGFEA